MSEHLQRGNKLWESYRMFLPEHKEILMEKKREKKQFQPPLLDEDQFEYINGVILQAIAYGYRVAITYSAIYGPETFSGYITKINHYEKWLKIVNDDDTLILEFKKIMNGELME